MCDGKAFVMRFVVVALKKKVSAQSGLEIKMRYEIK